MNLMARPATPGGAKTKKRPRADEFGVQAVFGIVGLPGPMTALAFVGQANDTNFFFFFYAESCPRWRPNKPSG